MCEITVGLVQGKNWLLPWCFHSKGGIFTDAESVLLWLDNLHLHGSTNYRKHCFGTCVFVSLWGSEVQIILKL